jgi:hypothetical protein
MSSAKVSGKALLCVPLLALLSALGCGLPGAPQPPSLELPRPVTDLRAVRKGSRVMLTWTPPQRTTDRKMIRTLGLTRICRVGGTAPMSVCQQVAEAPGGPAPARNEKTQAEFSDTLPSPLIATAPTGSVTYAVEVLNTGGRSAGLSNQVPVPTAPTAPPPERVLAKVTADGVEITASGSNGLPVPNSEFHLFRQPKDGAAAIDLGLRPTIHFPSSGIYSASFLDRNIEWDKTYIYHVAAVTTVTRDGTAIIVEGDDSARVEVLAHDIFPPAVPSGVQAVFAAANNQRFIDLTWTPNTDADLAGYHVYRHEEGGVAQRINGEAVKAPAFRDSNVVPGHRYLYSVSAVDVRGNESEKSAETAESVPQQ